MSFQGSIPFFNDAVAGAAVNVKAPNAGQVACISHIFGMKLVNTTGVTAYLQVFDVPAASVVLGTTVPKWVVRVSANETTNPSDVTPPVVLNGTGFSIAGTTGPGNNTGAAISVTLWFG